MFVCFSLWDIWERSFLQVLLVHLFFTYYVAPWFVSSFYGHWLRDVLDNLCIWFWNRKAESSLGLGKTLQSPASGTAPATSAEHGNCDSRGGGCLMSVSCSSWLRRKIWSLFLLHSLAIRTNSGCCGLSALSDCDNFTDCPGHHMETGNVEKHFGLDSELGFDPLWSQAQD